MVDPLRVPGDGSGIGLHGAVVLRVRVWIVRGMESGRGWSRESERAAGKRGCLEAMLAWRWDRGVWAQCRVTGGVAPDWGGRNGWRSRKSGGADSKRSWWDRQQLGRQATSAAGSRGRSCVQDGASAVPLAGLVGGIRSAKDALGAETSMTAANPISQ